MVARTCGCACGCTNSMEMAEAWAVSCFHCYDQVRWARYPDEAHAQVIADNRAEHEAAAERRRRNRERGHARARARRRKGGSDR